MGAEKNQGGGAAGKAARGGDAGQVMNAFEAAAAERAAKNAEKMKREEEKKKKEEVEARRKKKEAEKAAKEAAAKGGGAAGGGAAAPGDAKLKAVEKQFMPLVKKGDGLQDAGDLDGALALYQEAMDGFRAAGFKRPKLKEKIDDAKAKIAAGGAPEPAVDESVEINASVEAGA